MNFIQIRKSRIFLAFLLFLVIMAQAAGEREYISHVNPDNVTASDNNAGNYQLQILNELMSHWSGIFISLNKGDIKNAQKNLGDYLQLLQENNNILIKIKGDVYPELIKSGNTLNLTMNQVGKLRALYDEGKIAYKNNQTQKAIRIAVEARGITGDLNSYQDKFIMDSVEQYPGINVTDYQNGLSAYGELLNNLKKRQQPVELTLFDDSLISLAVHPEEAEFGDMIYIQGVLTTPKNRMGIPDANVTIKIGNRTITDVTTDRFGRYNYTYTVPYNKPGQYPINVEFVPFKEPLLSSYASSSFDLIPTNTSLTIEAKPDKGTFGDNIHISGILLLKNKSGVSDASISISLDNRTIGNVRTDTNGTYTYNLTVPAITEGPHTLKAEFIPDDEPLVQLNNDSTTTITVNPTKTALEISAPETVHQENYLDISWNVTTDKGFPIQNASITVLFDEKIIGNAIAKNSNFYVSYWIDRNITVGKHNITVKYNGKSPFLPSGKTIAIEILGPEFNYTLLYIIGVFGIMIFAFYLKKDRGLQFKIDSFMSSLNSRIGRTKTPQTSPELLKEERTEEAIKPDEPEIEEEISPDVEKEKVDEKLKKTFSGINDLIAKSQYNRSISLAYITVKNKISDFAGINNAQYLTHREFYSMVKDKIPAINDEMKELTEFYEQAMYSGIKVNKEHASKCVELANNIINKLKNET